MWSVGVEYTNNNRFRYGRDIITKANIRETAVTSLSVPDSGWILSD
jgi:hypothetical protein